MNKQVIKIIGNIIAIYLGSLYFEQISASSMTTIVMAGFVLWLVNVLIRPLLVLITIPVNILTLGLFSVVISTWMVMLVGKIIEGLWIGGFWTAFGLALLIAFINIILEKLLKDKK